MKKTAVIMAGGKGERFWPKSRANYPKQFLSLTDDGKTMLQKTVERTLPVVSIEDIYIVTGSSYTTIVKEQLPFICDENILTEPFAKNTTPCIGFAAAILKKKYNDSIMLVLPADHLIKNEEVYIDTILQGAEYAEEAGNIVTIGIIPTYPETGYGYINFIPNNNSLEKRCFSVSSFVEKPDINKAKEYVSSGKYLWNSGIFIWKTSTILNNFKKLQPDIYDGICRIGDAHGTKEYDMILNNQYSSFKSISIDYGIMEHAKDVYTIPGNFGWDDVGSWIALERINKSNDFNNVIQGDVVTIDTKDSIIVGSKKLIALIGVEDLVVVDSDDALLICKKDAAQNVKRVLENLKICNRYEVL